MKWARIRLSKDDVSTLGEIQDAFVDNHETCVA
jgi:hypothetical protein